jgi:F-type H+-transporting ATPase subunit b
MLIDWFTVGAQVLNFLILVWLMKRFLYKPILLAIDAREQKIAGELADAATRRLEAQKERNEFQHKNDIFDQERAVNINKVTEEAKVERQRLLEEARQDADSLRAISQDTLRNEQNNLSLEINRWTQKEVFAIARKTLWDLAATSLEQRIADTFIQRLQALKGMEKETLAAALNSSTQPASVRTAFDLPQEQKAVIQEAINVTFSAHIPIQFETVPEILSGIELTACGQRVAWSIADYLTTLEKSVDQLLNEAKLAIPRPKPDPKVFATPESKILVKSEPNRTAFQEPSPDLLVSKVQH